MLIVDVFNACASCTPAQRAIVNAIASFIGGAAAIGGSLAAIQAALPVPSPPNIGGSGAAIGDYGQGDYIAGGKAEAGPYGSHVEVEGAAGHAGAGPVTYTVDVANATAESEVGNKGYTGFGVSATGIGASGAYGSPTGDPTAGGDLYYKSGASLGVGASAHAYVGTDVDGDGRPEFGVGGSLGPATVDVRVEVDGPGNAVPPPPPPPTQWAPPPSETLTSPAPSNVPDAPTPPPPPASPAPAADPRPTPLPVNPASLPINPTKIDPPPLGPPPSPSPGFTTSTQGGQVVVTTSDGTAINATSTGGGGYTAQLPNGNVVTGNADGSTSVQLPDGSTQQWNASGQYTGTTPPDLGGGAGVNAPPPAHDTYVPMSNGGYRIDHPDGSSDIHWPDGTVVHANSDGITWTDG